MESCTVQRHYVISQGRKGAPVPLTQIRSTMCIWVSGDAVAQCHSGGQSTQNQVRWNCAPGVGTLSNRSAAREAKAWNRVDEKLRNVVGGNGGIGGFAAISSTAIRTTERAALICRRRGPVTGSCCTNQFSVAAAAAAAASSSSRSNEKKMVQLGLDAVLSGTPAEITKTKVRRAFGPFV